MSLELLLFAAQAGAQYLNTSTANRYSSIGENLQRKQIDSQFGQLQARALQENIDSTRQLQMTISSNAALSAMRGQRQGVGSALAVQNEAYKNYGTDRSIRDFNLEMNKYDSALQKDLVGINSTANKKKNNAEGLNTLIQSTSFNSLMNSDDFGFGKQKQATVVSAKPSYVRGY